MSDQDDEVVYRRSMMVDKVHVEVSGPDPDTVDRQFVESVEEAFSRYDEHVADVNGGYHD